MLASTYFNICGHTYCRVVMLASHIEQGQFQSSIVKGTTLVIGYVSRLPMLQLHTRQIYAQLFNMF